MEKVSFQEQTNLFQNEYFVFKFLLHYIVIILIVAAENYYSLKMMISQRQSVVVYRHLGHSDLVNVTEQLKVDWGEMGEEISSESMYSYKKNTAGVVRIFKKSEIFQLSEFTKNCLQRDEITNS